MSEIKYRQEGDYQIPELELEEVRPGTLGKYGLMRLRYLEEHNPSMHQHLLYRNQLNQHLREIDETASQRLEQMLPGLMKAAGVTEDLKASDQMQWVGLMNNVKAQAEEIILAELVYS